MDSTFFHYLKENSKKPLEKSIYNDIVRKSLEDFVELAHQDDNWFVVGSIAYGVWNLPRNTHDIDISLLSDNDIPQLKYLVRSKFKLIRPHALIHKETGVEIEITTPDLLKNVPKEIFQKAKENAVLESYGKYQVKVITPKYLIAMKLFRAIDKKNPKSGMDRSDIHNLILTYGIPDLSDLPMTKETLELFRDICSYV